MNKKQTALIIMGLAVYSGAYLILNNPAHAEEVNSNLITIEEIDSIPTDQPPEVVNPAEDIVLDTATEETPALPEDCLDENGNLIDCVVNENIEEGTSTEPIVTCATLSEVDCPDEEEETEPELWPLYLSLGALGFTILFVIIINILGRKKK